MTAACLGAMVFVGGATVPVQAKDSAGIAHVLPTKDEVMKQVQIHPAAGHNFLSKAKADAQPVPYYPNQGMQVNQPMQAMPPGSMIPMAPMGTMPGAVPLQG